MRSVFDKYYKAYDLWYDRNKFAYLSELAALRKVVPSRGRGLDIGVGTARFSVPLGIKEGIDCARSMVRISKHRGVDARLACAERLPYPDGAFNYAVLIVTLCFVKDPAKAVDEAKRVLKENGRLVIAFIDKKSFLGRYYLCKKGIFYEKARFFGVEEAAGLLKEAGFGRLAYYQTLFKPPRQMNSVEKPAKGFGRGGFVVVCGKKIKRRA